MDSSFKMSSKENDLIRMIMEPQLPRIPMQSQAGLDHLDNLCRLMEQLGVLREQNSRLQTRVQYLESIQQMSSIKDDAIACSSMKEEKLTNDESDAAQISTQGSKWGRMKTVLTQTRKESPQTQRIVDGDSGDVSKWRKMKRALTRRHNQASLQRSHSVPSSPTSGDPTREVLVRTDAGEFRFQGLDDTFRQRLVEWEKKKGVNARDSSLMFLEGSSHGTLERKLERNRSYSDSSVAGETAQQNQDVAPRSTSEPQLPSKPHIYKLMEEVKSKSETCKTLQRQVNAVDAEIDHIIEGQFQNLENYRKHVKKRGGRRVQRELSKVDEEIKSLQTTRDRIKNSDEIKDENFEKISVIDMGHLEGMCTQLCDQVKQLELKVADRSSLLQKLIMSHWLSFEFNCDKVEENNTISVIEDSCNEIKMGTNQNSNSNTQVRRLSDTSIHYEVSPKLDFATAFSTTIYDDEALQMPKIKPEIDTSVSVTVKLPSPKQTPSSPTTPDVTFVTLPAPKTNSRVPSVPLPSRLEPACKVKSIVAHFNQQGSPQPQQRQLPNDGVFKSSSFCSNQWTNPHSGVSKSASSNALYSDPIGWPKYSNESTNLYNSPRIPRVQPMSPRLLTRHPMMGCQHQNLNEVHTSREIASPPVSPRMRASASPRVARLKLRYAREEFLNRECPPLPNSPQLQWRNSQKKSIVEEVEPKEEIINAELKSKIEESIGKTSVTTEQKTSFFSFHLRRPKKQTAASHLCRQSLFVSLPASVDVGAERQSCPSSPAQQPKHQNKKTSWFMSTKFFKSK